VQPIIVQYQKKKNDAVEDVEYEEYEQITKKNHTVLVKIK
jgi:hypothetical protein